MSVWIVWILMAIPLNAGLECGAALEISYLRRT
jgi:hypothetical protein